MVGGRPKSCVSSPRRCPLIVIVESSDCRAYSLGWIGGGASSTTERGGGEEGGRCIGEGDEDNDVGGPHGRSVGSDGLSCLESMECTTTVVDATVSLVDDRNRAALSRVLDLTTTTMATGIRWDRRRRRATMKMTSEGDEGGHSRTSYDPSRLLRTTTKKISMMAVVAMTLRIERQVL